MPLQATSGAASYDGFGGGVAVVPAYIEEIFSTYLYTGTGSAQSIVNGIDESGKGALTWIKGRNLSWNHTLYDTVNGVSIGPLNTADTGAPNPANNQRITAFNSNGFTLGTNGNVNGSGYTYVSWTFRKQPKFFDVVTYTGTGSNTTIAHALNAVPGCIIVKRTDAAGYNWFVYHVSLGNSSGIVLNQTGGAGGYGTALWNSTDPTSTVFSLGTNSNVNASGGTYVAYLFAHDAGGFGLTGTDNVISCGSATVASANAVVTLGWEPQYVLYKQSDGVGAWTDVDSMRGLTVNQVANNSRVLFANNSNLEETNNGPALTSTGFVLPYAGGAAHGDGTYIYIAIRRGPMKVPTLGTSVFSPITSSASTGTVLTTSFPVDLQIVANRTATDNKYFMDRLRGVSTPGAAISTPILYSNLTDAEVTNGTATRSFDNTSFQMPGLFNGYSTIFYNFRRAPGFFDEVCYTGTGSATTQTHNLAAVPELMIVKRRNVARYWAVYASPLGATKWLELETVDPVQTDTMWNNTTPTASVFSIGTYNGVNGSGDTYVAYLFATCPGVSKVGSYTGTATTKQIDCGFTGGARFVLIKRTDSTGDWYVWDSARGIVAGNDPYLLLNSTAAEVTSTDYVDTYSAGFEISSTAPAAINASGGSFIFLAIA